MRSPTLSARAAAVATLVGLLAACGPAAAAATPLHARTEAPPQPGPDVAVGADTVRVLPTGRTAFPVIRALIDAATRRVDVEMYEFGRPDLTAALIRAEQRGVRVTVIDDPSVDVTALTALRLRAAGVAVIDYPVRALMIDHVKLLVVDGAAAVVGGINWGASSDRNHDFDALVRGPVATNLERVFLRDLATTGAAVTVPAPVPDPGILVAVTLPAQEIRPLAVSMIDAASRSLRLELFVLTDAGIVHALERAHGRGVDVTILLDPDQTPSDASEAALSEAGVAVRWYRGSGEKLHAKAIVADGHDVLFGSANWSGGGFERNHELDVEIVGSPGVAAAFETAMSADWAASAP